MSLNSHKQLGAEAKLEQGQRTSIMPALAARRLQVAKSRSPDVVLSLTTLLLTSLSTLLPANCKYGSTTVHPTARKRRLYGNGPRAIVCLWPHRSLCWPFSHCTVQVMQLQQLCSVSRSILLMRRYLTNITISSALA